MKKFILLFIGFLATYGLQAQIDSPTVKIEGKVNVSIRDDAGGINVFNLTNGQYTYTDDYGKFVISVKEGDELVFSSVQYQQFSVIINKGVIDKKELNVNLNTQATLLDEVVVKPDLSGDVRVDVRKIKTQKADFPDEDAQSIIYGEEYKFRPDRYTSPENKAIDKGYLQDGINFVNIFKGIFGIKSKSISKERPDFMDVQIRKIHRDDFFRKYLDLNEEEINEFVLFVEDRGLNVEKIKGYNDLELIEHLIDESKAYKAQKEEE